MQENKKLVEIMFNQRRMKSEGIRGASNQWNIQVIHQNSIKIKRKGTTLVAIGKINHNNKGSHKVVKK